MGTVVHDLWKLAAKMPDDPTLRAMIENGARELEKLEHDNARLRALLKEARQYVSDAGSHEEPGEHQATLLSDIDKALAEQKG